MAVPRLFSTYRGLHASVYVLFAARIVNRMGDFVRFFLVLYLTTRLGFSEESAGRFIMLTALVNGLGILAGGVLADRFSRTRVMVVCQLTFAASFAVCGFLPVSAWVPWIIFLSSGFRGATWPVSSAMVTDLTEGDDRRKAFSLLYLGTNIGVAIGPVLAGLLFQNHIAWIFWGDALTTLISAITILLFVPDTKPSRERIASTDHVRPAGERAEQGSFVSVFLRRPQLIAYLVIATLSSFVYSQHTFALPLQLDGLFGEGGAYRFGLLMTLNAITVLVCTAPLTYLTRHMRPVTAMALASLCYLVGFGSLLFIEGMVLFSVSVVIWTWGEILMVTNGNLFVSIHTPITHRGRFNGVVSWVHGVGFAISPWISGVIITQSGVLTIWPIAAGAAGISAMAFFLMSRIIPSNPE